ncbi:MAG: hypothetical protein NZ455_04930 [Bacteroidia bacterium]|nr:hypothetical protein [Bacteroidia bacterium]
MVYNVKIEFYLVCYSLSDTYRVKFWISGISLLAVCVRHAEGKPSGWVRSPRSRP